MSLVSWNLFGLDKRKTEIIQVVAHSRWELKMSAAHSWKSIITSYIANSRYVAWLVPREDKLSSFCSFPERSRE